MAEEGHDIIVGALTTAGPEPCGLKTYFGDFAFAVKQQFPRNVKAISITAIDTTGKPYKPLPGPKKAKFPINHVIEKYNPDSWNHGLEALLDNMTDLRKKHPKAFPVVYVNFEFGLFPEFHSDKTFTRGRGRQALELIRRAREQDLSTIVQLHTIRTTPSEFEIEIYREMSRIADAMITLSPSGRVLLEHVYDVDPYADDTAHIEYIHHGTWMPNIPVETHKENREKYGLNRIKRMTLDAGLQGDGKGIPLLLDAYGIYTTEFASEEERKNNVLIIAGQVHPGFIESEPERYAQFQGDKQRVIDHHKLRISRATERTLKDIDPRKVDIILIEQFLRNRFMMNLDGMAHINANFQDDQQQMCSGRYIQGRAAGSGPLTTPFIHVTDSTQPFELRGIPPNERYLLGYNNSLPWPIVANPNVPQAYLVQPRTREEIGQPYKMGCEQAYGAAQAFYQLDEGEKRDKLLTRMMVNNRINAHDLTWEISARMFMRLTEKLHEKKTRDYWTS